MQCMTRPDENFAVPDFDADPPKKHLQSNDGRLPVPAITTEDLYFGDVYWRGYFQLDTPMYPTVYGLVRILDDDENEYDTVAFVSFPFGQLRLEDDLNFIVSDFVSLVSRYNV